MKKLSIAIFTLALLSACGERGASPDTGEKPSAGADQEDASADTGNAHASEAAEEAKQARADAALADATANRVAAYKRALLPLVAADYAGDCTTSAGVKSRSAISVSAGGTVSAPGMKASSIMDADAMLMVNRGESAGTAPAISMLAGSDESKWTFHSRNTADEAAAYGSNRESIRCLNESSAVQPKAGNVYPAVAKFFIGASRSMKCNDFASLPRMLKVTPAATQVTVGNETFPLVLATAGERATVMADEKALTYETGVIDGDRIMLQLDKTGAMSVFTLQAGPGRKSLICEAEQR